MRRVERDAILDYETYSEKRPKIQERVFAIKAPRRIHVGSALTLLFENTDTIRYQILEMVRAERIVKEADIRHEIDTYNEILGGDGELGATLLIEIDDPAERDASLVRWIDLPSTLYVKLEDGSKVRATFDPRQVGRGRLSSVQYVKFPTGGRVPVAIGTDLPDIATEVPLDATQRAALAEDLAS